MIRRNRILSKWAAVASLALMTNPAWAQLNEDWVVFEDFFTGAQCGVVNASNAELIVLFNSGNMVVVTGKDVQLQDVLVNEFNEVSYLGEPAGVLEYLDDGDGLPAVFWTTLTGTLVGIDTFTAEPFDSGIAPEQQVGTICDACELIDLSPLCEDGSGDPGTGDGDGGDSPDGGLDIPLPDFCGAGAGGPAALAMVLLPMVALSSIRRRR